MIVFIFYVLGFGDVDFKKSFVIWSFVILLLVVSLNKIVINNNISFIVLGDVVISVIKIEFVFGVDRYFLEGR